MQVVVTPGVALGWEMHTCSSRGWVLCESHRSVRIQKDVCRQLHHCCNQPVLDETASPQRAIHMK
jgi:hypothetical protein